MSRWKFAANIFEKSYDTKKSNARQSLMGLWLKCVSYSVARAHSLIQYFEFENSVVFSVCRKNDYFEKKKKNI